MLNWIIAERFSKLPRPPVIQPPEYVPMKNSDDCFFRYFHDSALGLDGIVQKYSKYGVTLEDIKRANPNLGFSILDGLVLKIPYQCPRTMDKYFYMDSQVFQSEAIPRNGSLLLSFCFMGPHSRSNANQCEEFMSHEHGFDKNANIYDWKKAKEFALIRQIKPRRRLQYDQFELRRYNIDGKIHYAVVDSAGKLYDPGRDVVKDGYPYESFYYEEHDDSW
ncbi:hypothetical protein TVAG_303640 [Trichomonas vaginalis G3]|uniref:LysM domain-containing protein n=1 Tax=Trichomonas vaginalis (strain ATCC PRA-98 / G3) TaxID=412133 RepID=A2DR46_TRIV3|nr:LysM domain-containing protein [Trichomonas vaginalis G3]EAY17145.1 hypothetical protein TVAG_303640 [Trichomonas vaginalis G3]KAI5508861.1 LysM domain-containing protein [Trichomonas vaginalis G3]|eukprot:XP_001329368.1 hypothetical protein [Trichomonas vaginalis G3]